MRLSQRDLDLLKRDMGRTIHDYFTPLTCSVRTGYRLMDADGEPTDDLVCERCKPFVEHLIATKRNLKGFTVQRRSGHCTG